MSSDRSRRSRWAATLALAAILSLGAAPALADEYESTDSAHPLRIVAYVLHPVGVILDTLIVKPAHFLVSYEPLKTLFGHDEDY